MLDKAIYTRHDEQSISVPLITYNILLVHWYKLLQELFLQSTAWISLNEIITKVFLQDTARTLHIPKLQSKLRPLASPLSLFKIFAAEMMFAALGCYWGKYGSTQHWHFASAKATGWIKEKFWKPSRESKGHVAKVHLHLNNSFISHFHKYF